MHRSQRARRAFSLVELLIVISIIGLLAGMLLPVLQSARATAHSVSCQNNLKSIGGALLLYATNSRGRFPVFSDDYSTSPTDVNQTWVGKLLETMGDSRATFQCPTVPTQGQAFRDGGKFDPVDFPLGYNYVGMSYLHGDMEDPSRRGGAVMSTFRKPASTIMAGDGSRTELGEGIGFLIGGDPTQGKPQYNPHHRHEGRANILFVDGHVESLDNIGWSARWTASGVAMHGGSGTGSGSSSGQGSGGIAAGGSGYGSGSGSGSGSGYGSGYGSGSGSGSGSGYGSRSGGSGVGSGRGGRGGRGGSGYGSGSGGSGSGIGVNGDGLQQLNDEKSLKIWVKASGKRKGKELFVKILQEKEMVFQGTLDKKGRVTVRGIEAGDYRLQLFDAAGKRLRRKRFYYSPEKGKTVKLRIGY